MREKVLITGASGFLGFHLIEAALAKGLDVFAGIRKTSDISHLLHLPISYTYLDLSNVKSLTTEMTDKNYDYIIHAAGITKAKTQIHYNVVNADYSHNLALAVIHAGIPLKKFIYISSLAALGPLQNVGEVISESTTPHPVTRYGKSKLLSEIKLQEINLPLVIMRPTAIYGPRERDLLILFKMVKNNYELYIGKNDQNLSFVYVKDVADITVSTLFKSHNGTYNISDGNRYSRYDFTNYLKVVLKKKTIKLYLPYILIKMVGIIVEKAGDLVNKTPVINEDKLKELMGKNWVCSIEKAKKDLDYKPLFTLENGLVETVKWYRQYKWL